MKLAMRAQSVTDSITLKLNELAVTMSEEGQHVYNLTSGQLACKPMPEYIEAISAELNFLKSFQYAPVPGFLSLREKFLRYVQDVRGIDYKKMVPDFNFDCVISNGSKQSIYNVLGTLIDPDDEVLLLAPYWVSYPQMIEFWGGKCTVVDSKSFEGFVPQIDNIEDKITSKTKVIIVNSPNNPAGIHYDPKWMQQFAQLMLKYPDIFIISDEIYSELYYFDPAPTYFYQSHPELLTRTILINGISKSMAATGLRLGYCIANKAITDAVRKIQGQTTSGANSLVQRSLIDFDFNQISKFLIPVKAQLRRSAEIIRESFRSRGLASCWYQSTSAFYFVVDFSRTPMFEKYRNLSTDKDFSQQICEELLKEYGIALVPSDDFGIKNSARLSLTLPEGPFLEAIDQLTRFLVGD
jgi:aspartate aminotransferase